MGNTHMTMTYQPHQVLLSDSDTQDALTQPDSQEPLEQTHGTKPEWAMWNIRKTLLSGGPTPP